MDNHKSKKRRKLSIFFDYSSIEDDYWIRQLTTAVFFSNKINDFVLQLLTIQLRTILTGTLKLKEYDYASGAFMIYASVIDLILKLVPFNDQCRIVST